MLPIIYQALVALYFLPSVLAAANTLSACTTKLGAKSTSKVGSTTYALTITLYASTKQTNTPTITKTPVPTTVSVSSTATVVSTTTLQQVTDTFSTTSSVFVTSTETQTVTQTATTTTDVTVTADPSTTTIQPSPGFTPAASVVPAGQAGTAKKRDVLPGRRGKIEGRAATQRLLIQNHKPTFIPALYPTTVTCGVLVRTTSTRTTLFTAAPTTKTLPPSTVTSTIPVTITSTSTVAQTNAQTTLSFSTTIIQTTTTYTTTTTTQTATNTVTVTPPGPTVYAACASNNLLKSVNGQGIQFVQGQTVDGTFGSTDASSAYDCCVACLNDSNCAISAYSSPSTCYTLGLGSSTCSPNTNAASFGTGGDPADGFVVSDSNCGQLAYSPS
ncbi:MAG: hypothetical protein M1812_007102 [Candelaria pacifica]|nr:MAG: hypothetical protein M1812_007102 [Candelaria pacifica]